jgi:hypothetical protein
MEHFRFKNAIEEISITHNEIEAAIKNCPKKESSAPDSVSAEFYQTFKELIPTLLKFFHKVEMEGTLTNSFYKTNIIYIPKPEKEQIQKGKLQAILLNEHCCKNPE